MEGPLFIKQEPVSPMVCLAPAPAVSSDVGGVAAAAAIAAARASAAAKEATPPLPRRRGRPPMQGITFTKKYRQLIEWRARKKSLVATMEAEVAEKLRALQLLSAENRALLGKEKVLSQNIAAREEAIQKIQQEAQEHAATAAARPRSATPASGAFSGCGSGGGGGAGPGGEDGGSVSAAAEADSSCGSRPGAAAAALSGSPAGTPAPSSGGGSSSGAASAAAGHIPILTAGGAAAAGAVPDFGQLSADERARVDRWLSVYHDHMEHAIRERRAANGTVAPLAAEDPRYRVFREIMQDGATWPARMLACAAVYRVVLPPLQTRAVAEAMVATRLFTPELEAAVSQVFESQMRAIHRLEGEIATLQQEITSLGAVGAMEVAQSGLVARDEGELRSKLSTAAGGGRGSGAGGWAALLGGSGTASGPPPAATAAADGLLSDRSDRLVAGMWAKIRKLYELWNRTCAAIVDVVWDAAGEAAVTQWGLLMWPHLLDAVSAMSAYRELRLGPTAAAGGGGAVARATA